MKLAKRYSTQQSRRTYRTFAFSLSGSSTFAFRHGLKQNRYPAKFSCAKYLKKITFDTPILEPSRQGLKLGVPPATEKPNLRQVYIVRECSQFISFVLQGFLFLSEINA